MFDYKKKYLKYKLKYLKLKGGMYRAVWDPEFIKYIDATYYNAQPGEPHPPDGDKPPPKGISHIRQLEYKKKKPAPFDIEKLKNGTMSPTSTYGKKLAELQELYLRHLESKHFEEQGITYGGPL